MMGAFVCPVMWHDLPNNQNKFSFFGAMSCAVIIKNEETGSEHFSFILIIRYFKSSTSMITIYTKENKSKKTSVGVIYE